MSTIQEVLTGLDGDFYKEYKNLDQEVTNVEYFSGHLKKETDYSATIFVCITPERRTYINRKPVRWTDGNSQITGKENQLIKIKMSLKTFLTNAPMNQILCIL